MRVGGVALTRAEQVKRVRINERDSAPPSPQQADMPSSPRTSRRALVTVADIAAAAAEFNAAVAADAAAEAAEAADHMPPPKRKKTIMKAKRKEMAEAGEEFFSIML